ncbi:MAG: hypothetical protein Q4D62_15470 [Planctomycetia bacterium]|nr:hypothetical protein [Planctomycetia bacterium]
MNEQPFFSVFNHPAAQLAFALLTGVVSWFVRGGFEKWPSLFRFFNFFQMQCWRYLGKSEVVFLWCDDLDTKRNWLHSLRRKNIVRGHRKTKYVLLSEPKKILQYPLPVKQVPCIIFLDSDVTKFAMSPKQRDAIEAHIKRYVTNGGVFFSSHDVLYRRVHNQDFCREVGYEINVFIRVQSPIKYQISKTSNLAEIFFSKINIENDFELDDTEICYSNNPIDNFETITRIVLCWSDTNDVGVRVPLFFVKILDKGLFFWINSGDNGPRGQCPSLRVPDEKLVNIVSYIIKDREECLEILGTQQTVPGQHSEPVASE